MREWVREIVESTRKQDGPEIGQTWIYKGKPVQIVGGRFWGEHGISNWWEFCEILPGGQLGPVSGAYDNDREVFFPAPEREGE